MKKLSASWFGGRVVVALCAASLLVGCFAARRADEILAEHGVTWEADTTTTGGVVDEASSTSTGGAWEASSTTTSEGSMGLEEGMEAGTSTGTEGSTSDETTRASETTAGAVGCGNGVVEAGESCDDANEVDSDGCDACVRESLVFVSSEHYQGKDLDGVFGADQRCRSLAAKAGLRRFETFKAWLSSTVEPAEGRLEHSQGRYVLVNGLVVADDWDELTSGELQRPIEVTEESETLHWPVWTGTFVDGTTAAGSSQCGDWTTLGSEKAARGSSAYRDAFWTFIDHSGCQGEASIYCVEQ